MISIVTYVTIDKEKFCTNPVKKRTIEKNPDSYTEV